MIGGGSRNRFLTQISAAKTPRMSGIDRIGEKGRQWRPFDGGSLQ
jgi:hypothetical protein